MTFRETGMKCRVEESIHINADPADVSSRIVDFNQWPAWSPWSVLEPGHHQEIQGEPGVPGSRMTWQGELLGSGVNTLVSVTGREVVLDLRFLEPYRSRARVTFFLTSAGEGTRVTWVMETRIPFFLFFRAGNMKAEIGMAYRRGLEMLRELVEQGVVDAETTDCGIVEFPGCDYIGLKRTSPFEQIAQGMVTDYGRIHPLLGETGPGGIGAVAVYLDHDMARNRVTYVSAVPQGALREADPGPDFVRGRIPAQKVLEIRHRGAYRFLPNAWAMGMMTVHSGRMKSGSPPFEYYHNDPGTTAERDLVTSVYIPLTVG